MINLGQVSLPVLSRKGKNDYWTYNWTTRNHYEINFVEDLFIKQFIFNFFMYAVSINKNNVPIFYKNSRLFKKMTKSANYTLDEINLRSLYNKLNNRKKNKHYLAKIYLCRFKNWLYIYTYTYNFSGDKNKLKHKNKLKAFNEEYFYQIYLYSKYKYITFK